MIAAALQNRLLSPPSQDRAFSAIWEDGPHAFIVPPSLDSFAAPAAAADFRDPAGIAQAGIVPLGDATANAATSLAKLAAAQGDRALGGGLARSQFNVTGAGIQVGILSDSFNVRGGYAADIASGALPAGIAVLREGTSSGGDEGRAMAQLVHQVAPGADLMFYTAFRGEADFGAGIKALAAAGCDVIVDDVTYLSEPFFQDGGIVQSAVASVVAQGVSYFTSASNQGSNFYQQGFAGLSAKVGGLGGTYKAHNFGTAALPSTMQSLTIATGRTSTIDLQWDQPFASIGTGHAAGNSLGLVLYNAAGKIVASALTNRTGGDPVQILRFTNTTTSTDFRLAIVTNGGATAPNLFKYIVYGQGTVINDAKAGIGSGTVIGHEMQAGANSVGAIAASSAPSIGGNGRIEAFSSVGPGKVIFDAKGNRHTDSVTARKVDFVAPDGIATSVYNPFYGTSAAAPNAAAVAALMLDANATLTPAQVTAILAKSAIKVTGAAGGIGAGFIQAAPAVQLAVATPIAAGTRSAGGAVNAALADSGAASGPQTSAWTTLPLVTPVAAALAAIATDPTAAVNFFVQIDPISLATDVHAETGAVFALTHHIGADVLAVLPDWSVTGRA